MFQLLYILELLRNINYDFNVHFLFFQLGYDDEGLTLRSLVEAAYAVPQSLDDIDWDAAVAFDPEPFSTTPSSYPSALSVTPGTIREGNGVSGAFNNRFRAQQAHRKPQIRTISAGTWPMIFGLFRLQKGDAL